MSKPRENKTRTLEISAAGEVPGIRVIGFHGEVDATHTPARRAPILADEEGWLVRLSPEDVFSGEAPGTDAVPRRVRAERGSLRVDVQAATLPGVGTKLGPWPARLGDTIMLVGEAERRASSRLAARLNAGEPAVEQFVFWLDQGCPPAAPARAAQKEALIAWCCGQDDAHSLWVHILHEARLAAMNAFAQGQPEPELERAAWWLSRAALSDEDLYLAAAALKRAGSPDAEAMLRAMLSTVPGSDEIQKRLEEQFSFLRTAALLPSPSRFLRNANAPAAWPYSGPTPDRDRVRLRARGMVR